MKDSGYESEAEFGYFLQTNITYLNLLEVGDRDTFQGTVKGCKDD